MPGIAPCKRMASRCTRCRTRRCAYGRADSAEGAFDGMPWIMAVPVVPLARWIAGSRRTSRSGRSAWSSPRRLAGRSTCSRDHGRAHVAGCWPARHDRATSAAAAARSGGQRVAERRAGRLHHAARNDCDARQSATADRKPPYDPVADFAPVALIAEIPLVLIAQGFPAKSRRRSSSPTPGPTSG